MTQTNQTTVSIGICNKLLRRELTAVQTYEMAIRRHPGVAATFNLDQISNGHRRSVRLLKAAVLEMGGEPEGGFRGIFARSIRDANKFPGAKSMMESLRQCEEQGRNDYEDALDTGGAVESFKALIRTELLTSVEDHLARLETLPYTVA